MSIVTTFPSQLITQCQQFLDTFIQFWLIQQDTDPIFLDDNGLYYKGEPYTPHALHQQLIVTYSPKYTRYQKSIRDAQVERAEKDRILSEKRKDYNISSIKIPYPFFGSFTNTCVTAPISFPS